MRIAHLIITYTNPAQTERMIRRMWHADFDFYIHVDAKLPVSSHAALIQIPNVYLIKNRIKVRWAGFSTVQATLNSLKEILAGGKEYDFISLMSGQDYPIKPVTYMQQFFAARKGKLLLKYRAFEGDWEEAVARINQYHFTDFSFRGRYLLERLINFVLRRTAPAGMKFYGSSMFWAITPEAASYVIKRVEGDRQLKRFFLFAWGTDEFLFQTLLLNSPFSSQVVNENCHFYLHAPNIPNPEVLTMERLPAIIASDRIYARKFNLERDHAVLDAIDSYIDKASDR
jgi:hypothetical protein